ncbi:lytic transglycosylase domain-containing protein [Reinekea blandensis]|uniref:Soluble lytic murein transglycosylase and related regulatory protein (Some contain LysM/invasin domains) n=1 Tax=Reinekea blandensis MED297 TaxID=314283 RepID=A4BCM9_9GAMM|nr:lytic transglycosylase domain-containing protein [Reinekea blandensis]EAR10295.1 Soluble lytic murein transglycosylase and related regulatory protein (some contain LysM/invasin domains) [Reinekea sp. MED297] [Reinekea blandensis MED297]
MNTQLKRLLKVWTLPLLLFCIQTSQADAPESDLVAALKNAVNETHSFEDEYVGQVWLAGMSAPLSRWIEDPEQRIHLLTMIHHEATRAGLEPGLVLALIQVESAFDNYAISYAGARGMMQIMPFWKKEIGREDDNLMDVATNLRYGTTILAHYLELEDGSVIRALARYNGSRGQTWYPKRVLTYWHQYWRLGE